MSSNKELKYALLLKAVTLSLQGGIVPVSPFIHISRTTNDGYDIININGVQHKEHNVIYALHIGHWPINLVDHKDGNRRNNSILNLRDATYSENSCNRGMRSDNTLGYKGIFKRELKGGYKGKKTVYGWMIKVNGTAISKSGFLTPEAAYKSRCEQLVLAHGEFARPC